MDKGYVHLYTGDGKGKSTAAFGLALRAAMSGKKVYIGQFVKDMEYNETKIKDIVDNIDIEQLGRGCFIFEDPAEEDKQAAMEGLKKCIDVLKSGKYGMVILDELTIALYFKLFDVETIVEAIKERNEKVEVVMTGRYAPKELYDLADLVTEMKEVKHYYKSEGLLARDGIER